jgi:hypothetical protein
MGMEGLVMVVVGAFTEERLSVGKNITRNVRQIGRN